MRHTIERMRTDTRPGHDGGGRLPWEGCGESRGTSGIVEIEIDFFGGVCVVIFKSHVKSQPLWSLLLEMKFLRFG